MVRGFDRNGVGAVAALPVANHLVVTQGATPGPAASSTDVFGISELLVDAPSKLLPKEVVQHLKKVARPFDKSVDRYVRNKRPVRKVEEDLVIMRDGSSRRYPPGVRPFASQGDLETLDEPLMGSTGNACVITITIPKNSTIKDSMEIVHHRAALFMKECNLEALLLLQTSLAPIISNKHVYSACNAYHKDEAEGLGLDEPRRAPCNINEALACAEDLYTKIIDKAREKNKQAIAEKHAQTNKQQDDLDAVAAAKHENALQELVAHTVQKN